MPSFELNKLQVVSPPRAVAETGRSAIQSGKGAPAAALASAPSGKGVKLEVNASVNAASPPVDNERVELIRDALRDGTYPIVPTEIADAMIAAQISFGMDQ